MTQTPKASPAPGVKTQESRGEKDMPTPSAKPLSEENKETREEKETDGRSGR